MARRLKDYVDCMQPQDVPHHIVPVLYTTKGSKTLRYHACASSIESCTLYWAHKAVQTEISDRSTQ